MTEQGAMTRDEARAHWAKSGLTYDVLTKASLARLRKLIDTEMRKGDYVRGTLRAGRAGTLNGRWGPADIRCQGYYFNDRQAVTFEKGGFVGFAGWADDTNVQPILAGFCVWVNELKAASSAAGLKSAEGAMRSQPQVNQVA